MRWKNRPEGSNWGEFGPDDQLGRLNYLTPEKTRHAALIDEIELLDSRAGARDDEAQ